MIRKAKRATPKPKLGNGKRFSSLVTKLTKGGKSKSAAKAIAASIGRKKYGAKKMASLSVAGRRRAARKK